MRSCVSFEARSRCSRPPLGRKGFVISEEQVSILFTDVSGFSRLIPGAIPSFVTEVTGVLAKELKNHAPRIVNTWGDAIFLVFGTPKDAAKCAIDLRDAIRDTIWVEHHIYTPVAMRIALHNASVTIITDPVTGELNAYGAHVNQTARLEPVALPNEIFTTDDFRRALESMNLTPVVFAWDEIGKMRLAKDWGETRVHRLRKPSEQPLGTLDLEALHASSNVIEELMPHAQHLLVGGEEASAVIRTILNDFDTNSIGKGVIRRNWTMINKYSYAEDEGIIVIREWL